MLKKKPSLGIFLHVKGAFNNVKFESIITALKDLGIPDVLVSWIENMLRNRTIQVQLLDVKVQRKVTKGCLQGGILSPFLWNCIMDPLLKEFEKEEIHAQAFVDDVAALVASQEAFWVRRRAQKVLNIASEWAQKNGLQFSCNKTELVIFTHRRKWFIDKLWLNRTGIKNLQGSKAIRGDPR